MKFKNPMLVVKDLAMSKAFYGNVLGLHIIADFGANVTLTGGVCLQTEETWKEFIANEEISYGGKDAELYFEEENFDAFLNELSKMKIEYVRPVFEHRWGQRVVRFFDPDRHVIEVGESMKTVCRRFLDGGMTEEEAAERMDVPVSYVRRMSK